MEPKLLENPVEKQANVTLGQAMDNFLLKVLGPERYEKIAAMVSAGEPNEARIFKMVSRLRDKLEDPNFVNNLAKKNADAYGGLEKAKGYLVEFRKTLKGVNLNKREGLDQISCLVAGHADILVEKGIMSREKAAKLIGGVCGTTGPVLFSFESDEEKTDAMGKATTALSGKELYSRNDERYSGFTNAVESGGSKKAKEYMENNGLGQVWTEAGKEAAQIISEMVKPGKIIRPRGPTALAVANMERTEEMVGKTQTDSKKLRDELNKNADDQFFGKRGPS